MHIPDQLVAALPDVIAAVPMTRSYSGECLADAVAIREGLAASGCTYSAGCRKFGLAMKAIGAVRHGSAKGSARYRFPRCKTRADVAAHIAASVAHHRANRTDII